MQRHVREREYWASSNAQGLQAPNRRHDLRTYFGPTGIRVVDRRAAGSPDLVSLSLAGFGRGEALTLPEAGEVVSEQGRVEIRRPDLLEWYENSPEGLEQGFTLEARPSGDGPVVVELSVEGGAASLRGDEVVFRTAVGRRLRYGAFEAQDATGRALQARLEVTLSNRVRLRVDDTDAIYPIVLDPLLTGMDDARLEADQASSEFGLRVSGAGDVNADGFADVIVGARSYDSGHPFEGAAFVFLGSVTGISDGSPLTAHAQLESNQAEALFGIGVSGAGDVNGDGYDDVIVGARLYDNGQPDEGAAFVFLGSVNGIIANHPTNPGGAHMFLESDQADARFGQDVSGAGDVNGDGYADVVVGAWYYDAGEVDEGAAFVFLGGAGGIVGSHPGDAHARLEGNQVSAHMGVEVSGAGDVNGDGYSDVIVGAYHYDAGETDEGAAFVFLGSALGIADASPATAHAQLESDQQDSLFGLGAASAGDVNGDGFSDVIVGARQYDNGEVDEGAAFVFLGSASGIADASPATAHAQLESNQAGALLGNASGAGDVNGDGYSDVIVGAYYFDGGQAREGAVFVFLGSASGILGSEPESAYAHLESDQVGARMGIAVSEAGDVDGDGFSDVIVGAYQLDGGQLNEGAAFVFLGGAEGIANFDADGNPMAEWNAPTRLICTSAYCLFGSSLSGAGDVNGDGYDDVLVGAPDYDSGQAGEGAVFLFLGSESGIASGGPLTADTQLESDQVGAGGGLGAGVGDVNGDGFADVIVGAYRYDNGQTDEGAAFVFLGSASGIASGGPATADAQLESNQANALFGNVAGAGDVNGDGFADVIVTAWQYDSGQTDEGAAFVFLGSADGIVGRHPGNAHARIESNQAWVGDPIYESPNVCCSVSGAGDVNGDGYADIVVGAPGYNVEVVDWVTVGGAGNVADSTGYGGVATEYRISKTEVTNAQYAEFLNAKAATDPNALYNTSMGSGSGGITRSGSPGSYSYSAIAGRENMPVNFVSFYDSLRFANWLGNGQGSGDTETGAYTITASGISNNSITRNAGATIFLPSEDEWYKAAYYDAATTSYFDYPVGSDTPTTCVVPGGTANTANCANAVGDFTDVGSYTGSASPNGTFDQGGNVSEWNETIAGQLGSTRGARGGSYGTGHNYLVASLGGSYFPQSELGVIGFRVASRVPSPAEVTNEGAAFVFLGSASGIANGSPDSAHALLASDQADSDFGRVSGAGDVNGDGYADIIIGARGYAAGQNTLGAAFVFLGSAAGIANASPASAHAVLRPEDICPNPPITSPPCQTGFGWSVAGAGDVNADGYADVIVGAPFAGSIVSSSIFNGFCRHGEALVFLGSAAGISDGTSATADTRFGIDPQACDDASGGNTYFTGLPVSGVGDINGDGYADVGVTLLVPTSASTSRVVLLLGNGDGDGRPVVAQQRSGDGSSPVQAWGSSLSETSFVVRMTATHPEGRGRVKLEVEACGPGVGMGDPSCTSHIGASWADVSASAGGVQLNETVTGLSEGTLYRWRARVLYAPYAVTQPGITPPSNPAHGPWRRLSGQVEEADVRVGLPESGFGVSLLAGIALLGWLRGWHRREAD